MSKWVMDNEKECPKCGGSVEVLIEKDKSNTDSDVKFVRAERCIECGWGRGLDQMEEELKLKHREIYKNEKTIEYWKRVADTKKKKIQEKDEEIEKLEEKWAKTVSGSLRDFEVKSAQVGKLMDHLNYLRRRGFLTDEQKKKFLKTFVDLYEDVYAYMGTLSEEIDKGNYPFGPIQ